MEHSASETILWVVKQSWMDLNFRDLYKVKTFSEITKLEKNGMFVYESVPGTAVENFKASEAEVAFCVSEQQMHNLHWN